MEKIVKKISLLILGLILFMAGSSVQAAFNCPDTYVHYDSTDVFCTEEDNCSFTVLNTRLAANEITGTTYFGSGADMEPGHTYFKVSKDNEILYCSNALLSTWALDGVEEAAMDKCCRKKITYRKSLIYIYEYGYNENKSAGEYKYNSNYLTGTDARQDYYITQSAVWGIVPPGQDWLQNDWNNSWFKLGYNFTNGTYFGVTYPTVTKISALVNDAKAAQNAEPSLKLTSSSTKMNVTSDGKYYISKGITVTGKYLTEAITISVSGVDGAFVTTDENATSGITTISDGTLPSVSQTLYVKVPVGKVADAGVNIKLNVSSKSTFNDVSEIIECDPYVNNYASGEDGITNQSMIKYEPSYTVLSDEMTFTANKYPVKVSKRDTAGAILKGATLVMKQGGTVIKTWPTISEVQSILLVPGTYTLSELTPPEGYITKNTTITFTLDNDGKVYVSGKVVDEISLENEPIMVMISKKAITGEKELAGAGLKIVNSDGETVKDVEGNALEWTSEEEPMEFHLAPGTYILVETIAPLGYKLMDTEVEFTVLEDGKVMVDGDEVSVVVMFNEPIMVTFSKISIASSDELAGAGLKITDNDGNVMKDYDGNALEWVSTTQAKEFHLIPGTYVLSETIAPEGYELSETTIEFTITDEGKVLVGGKEVKDNLIVFKNTPEPVPVPTGSAIMYVAIAVGAIAIGAATYLVIRKKAGKN